MALEKDLIAIRQYIQKLEKGILNGDDGLTVYITYHDSDLGSTPSNPTGDGTTGGWHTDSTANVNWMSTKTAASQSEGTWGDPMAIRGLTGDDAVVYYIKPVNGTAIKNSEGTLTIEAHRIAGGSDTLLSSGTIKLYDPSNNEVTEGNGYVAGSDGYTGILDSGDIDSSKVITLKNGTGGSPLDTITLVDVLDGAKGDTGDTGATGEEGADGADAIVASVNSNNGLAWTQAAGPGAWTPEGTTTTLTVTYYQGGASINTRTVVITRDGATLTAPEPDTVDGITYSRLNNSSSAITIVFEHVASGIKVAETVYAVAGAADGADGEDGEDGTDGSGMSDDVWRLTGITFIGNTGSGKVGWTAGTVDYGGSPYSITGKAVDDGSTNAWIYWDADDSNTTFKTTNDFAVAQGEGNWPVCWNNGGVAIPAAAFKIILAGMLKVSTLSAICANMGTITAGTISADLITAGTLIADRIQSATLQGITSTTTGWTPNTIYPYTEDAGYGFEVDGTGFNITNTSQKVSWIVRAKYSAGFPLKIRAYLKSSGGTKVYTSTWTEWLTTSYETYGFTSGVVSAYGFSVNAVCTPGIEFVAGVNPGTGCLEAGGRDNILVISTGTLSK